MTTDIHNTACIPPSAKRSTTASALQHPPPMPTSSVPFSPMDQIEELDVVAAYCSGYSTTSAATVAAVSAASSSAVTAASTSQEVPVDCLEKALGIEFSPADPNGVVQRQLLAK